MRIVLVPPDWLSPDPFTTTFVVWCTTDPDQLENILDRRLTTQSCLPCCLIWTICQNCPMVPTYLVLGAKGARKGIHVLGVIMSCHVSPASLAVKGSVGCFWRYGQWQCFNHDGLWLSIGAKRFRQRFMSVAVEWMLWPPYSNATLLLFNSNSGFEILMTKRVGSSSSSVIGLCDFS